MISDDELCQIFYEAANRRIAIGCFAQVVTPQRLHAPIQAYVEWIGALKEIAKWQHSEDRVKRKGILDGAIVAEFESISPDRWQRCAVLITHVLWTNATGTLPDQRIIDYFGRDYAANALSDFISQSFLELYQQDALETQTGPCSLFYFAQAAMLVDGVYESAPPAVSFYMQVVASCLNATQVLNSIPDDLTRQMAARPRLRQYGEILDNEIQAVDKTVAQIQESIDDERSLSANLQEQLSKTEQEISTATPSELPILQQRKDNLRQRLERIDMPSQEARAAPNLDFLRTRILETRASLEEKKRAVDLLIEGVLPNSQAGPMRPLSAAAKIRILFSGNPRRMTSSGWMRLVCVCIAFAVLTAAVAVGVLSFVFWNNASGQPALGNICADHSTSRPASLSIKTSYPHIIERGKV